MIQPVLNKLDRNTVYINALIFYNMKVNEGVKIGLCEALGYAIAHLGVKCYHPLTNRNVYTSYMDYYPELNKWKPEGIDLGFWFPLDHVNTRMVILKQAIKETNGY